MFLQLWQQNPPECLIYILRYLKNSEQNEPNLKWNSLMRKLIAEMIHYRNEQGDVAYLENENEPL